MERKSIQALRAVSLTAATQLSDLMYYYLDWIDCFSYGLDSKVYYDVIKAYKQAKNDISLYLDDLSAIAVYYSKQMAQDIGQRVNKQLVNREKDQWDIDLINKIVLGLETSSVLIQDLLELTAESPTPEIQKQIDSLKDAPEKLQAFKNNPFTEICRALDEANKLALTDRVVNVPDSSSGSGDQPLLIQMEADKVHDFNSSLKVYYEKAIQKGAVQEVPFKSEFAIKSLNRELGEATGIVMPAGSVNRRYLDGDYFPDDVVRMSMIGWILDSPQINRDHEASDLFNFWEHPHFRIVETWQERTGFMLGGEMVQPGDWVATIRAVTDEARDGLMTGLFNGFSVEGMVTYYPDELLASSQNS